VVLQAARAARCHTLAAAGCMHMFVRGSDRRCQVKGRLSQQGAWSRATLGMPDECVIPQTGVWRCNTSISAIRASAISTCMSAMHLEPLSGWVPVHSASGLLGAQPAPPEHRLPHQHQDAYVQRICHGGSDAA